MYAKVISSGVRYSSLPESYIRPESERPRLSEVSDCEDVPVIDLGCKDRPSLVRQIGDACQNCGFFQVINHGVRIETVESMFKIAHDFFNMPVEEKLKLYSDDPSKTMRLSTGFNVYEGKLQNWIDYLRLHCYPLDKYVPKWPSNPPQFKEIVRNYCIEVRELGFRLQELISESLGLEKDHIKNVLGEQGQHMVVKFYPPCPEPGLAYGLPGHTDSNALTIFLQDLQVSGFQVLKDGRWVAVKPHPNAFVINIGDQLQVMSNGRYKSVWHGTVVNSAKPTMSVTSFLCSSDDAVSSSPKSLTRELPGHTDPIAHAFLRQDSQVTGLDQQRKRGVGMEAERSLKAAKNFIDRPKEEQLMLCIGCPFPTKNDRSYLKKLADFIWMPFSNQR